MERSAQDRVDAWYKNLVNTGYDVAHGHASPDALVVARQRYQDALDAHDAEEE